MAIDTPARLAILGAGPIGLEAALYARFLGYDVVIFEAGDVAQSVRRWGHVRMFTPFAHNHSTLGLAAIQAQDEQYAAPPADALLTGHEWISRYLLPLSQTDLLSDHLRLNTTVVAVGKEELLQGDLPGEEVRGEWSFRVLARDAAGAEGIDTFDGVIDCTGVFGQPNRLGHGGIWAAGEAALTDEVEYRLPDILGADRERYTGRHTLLIGAGASAATNAIALVELAKNAPGTRVTWITRREGPAGAGGPLTVSDNDPLPQRAVLSRAANALAAAGAVQYWPATVIEGLSRQPSGTFAVELSGQHAGTLEVDRILANVGFRPDCRIFAELQIDESAISHSTDDLVRGPQALFNPEPNFYVLGHKSFGRRPDFAFQIGLDQIRQLFTILGERETLDLYAGATRLLRS